MENFHNWLLKKFKFYQSFVAFLKEIELPFFESVPLYYIIKFFILELVNGDLTHRASAIAFNLFIAIFPAIILLFTLIAYIPIENFSEQLLTFFEEIMPRNAFLTLSSTIEDIASNKRGNLLSFGFILALYFASNGIHALMTSFNKANEIFENRTFIKQKLISISLTFVLVFIFLVSIGLIIGSEIFINYLHKLQNFDESWSVIGLIISNWIITLTLIFFAISILFYYGPATNVKWRFISPGAILATLLIIITSLGFSYYINHFGQYNKLYGSIGTLIVIMLWVYFNSIALLIGFELNASIYLNKKLLNELEE